MTSSAVAQLVVGARTDVGSVRTRNEDCIYTEPVDSPQTRESGWVGVVADGLGGHPSGDFASRLAAQTTRDVFYKRSHESTGERLRSAVKKANEVIVQTAQTEVQHADMASTITAAVIQGATVFMAQVGDSRGYLIRNGRVRRVTRDHSLVDELVRSGELTAEEALHHPQRNVITRALLRRPVSHGRGRRDGAGNDRRAAAGGGDADRPGQPAWRPGQHLRSRGADFFARVDKRGHVPTA